MLSYRIPAKKVQLRISEATYLHSQLKEGKRSLSQKRIATILQIPIPKTKRQNQGFLGTTGYCCLWIPEEIKPLYTSTEKGTKSLICTETKQKTFEALKTALTSASALKRF